MRIHLFCTTWSGIWCLGASGGKKKKKCVEEKKAYVNKFTMLGKHRVVKVDGSLLSYNQQVFCREYLNLSCGKKPLVS